ncbi:hypothetical protein [Streptomyces sp. NRRL S-340]|uniref:hypothetical protein n=1 Tax=Streptomyces sp. NRRL S-340 TaxID=1463901 RepID=UPI000568A443|nr:hypothetical protein [Streptomyces sp. NRRL S-340]
MSHASITSDDLVSPRSTRVTGTATARPLLVVETLDHSAGSTVQFTYTYAGGAAPRLTFRTPAAAADHVQFTFCAQPDPVDHAQFTFCAQPDPSDDPMFTFCAHTASADASGAWTADPVAVEEDAVAGAWI